MMLQRPDLAIGKVARIALLQFVEHRSAIPFRLQGQPIADLLPHACEWIRAAAVGARPLRLLRTSVLPLGPAVWVQSDGLGRRLIVSSTARAEIEAQRHEFTGR